MTKKCKHCGKEFEATDKRQKYCSEMCRLIGRSEYQKEYRKAKNKQLCEIVCPVCHKKFMPRTGNQVVCSGECRKVREKEQQKIRNKTSYAKKRLKTEMTKAKPTFKSKGIEYRTLSPEQKFFYGRTQLAAYADELTVAIPRGLTKVKYRDA